MTQDLYYYESGYIDTSYFVYTADAEAAVTSTSTVTASVGVIKSADSAMTVTAGVTATISHIEGADLFAFTEAALSAEVSRIRNNNIEVSSSFSVATDISRIIHVSADDNVSATLVADNLRVRYAQAATSAALSLTADLTRLPGVVVDASGAWSATATVECKGTRKTNIVDADVSSSFTQTTNGSRIRFLTNGLLEVNASQASQINRVASGLVSMTSTSQVACTISHIEGADLQAFGQANLSAEARVIRGLVSAQTAEFAQSATVREIAGLSAAITSQSALAVGISITGSSASAMTSQATLSAQATKAKMTSASMSAQTLLSAIGYNLNSRPRQFEVINSTISTTSKFGTGSVRTLASVGRDKLYASRDWNIAANQDFVFECWIYPDRQNSSSTVTLIDAGIFSIQVLSTRALRLNILGSSYTGLTSQSLTANTWNWIQVRRRASEGNVISFNLINGSGYQGIYDISHSGSIGNGTGYNLYIGATPSVTNGINQVLYDEIYFAKGYGDVVVNLTQTQQIDFGNADSVQALFHFNGNYQDDMSGIFYAGAALTSVASLTAQAAANVKLAQAACTATSQINLTANANRTTNAALSANGFVVTAIGRIRPQVAAMDSQFNLTAALVRTKNASASLSSNLTVDAVNQRVRFATVNVTAMASILATTANMTKQTSADIVSTASLVANPDDVRLQLIYKNTGSGFITSTGTTIRTTFSGTSGTRGPGYGFNPVQSNFWLALDTNLTSGQKIIVYKSNTNQIVLQRGGTLPTGQTVSSSNYYIYTTNRVEITLTATGTSWTRERRTELYGADLGNIDLTVPINVHIPLSLGYYIEDHSTNGLIGPYGSKWADVIRINGSTITADYYSTATTLGSSASFIAPTTVNEALGGQWGDSTNPTTVYLDQIWLRSDPWDMASYPNSPRYTATPIGDFYDQGYAAYITKTGVTLSGLQAQVWLPFGTLLDRSSLSPTWNYTANNQVIPGLIKTTESYLSAAATVAATPIRIVQFSSSINSNFAQTTNGGKIRFASADLTSQATVTASLSRLTKAQSQLTSTATVSAQARKSAVAQSQMTSTSQLAISYNKIRDAAADLTSRATVTAQARVIRSAISQQTAQAQIQVTALRTKQLAAGISAMASELAVVVKTGRGLIHAQTTATVTAQVRLIADRPINMNSTATLTATVRKVVFGTSTLGAQAQLTANPNYLRRNQAQLTSQFVQSAAAKKTTGYRANLTSQAVITAVNTRRRNLASVQNAVSTLAVNNQIVRLGSAQINSQFVVLASAFKVFRARAVLQCQGFMLTAGRVITLDPATTLKVRSETRYLKVLPEVRDLIVASESRIYKIKDKS